MRNIGENELHFLFRRGQKEYLENLLYKGEVYLNTIDFIRRCDENWERTDMFDSYNFREFLGKGKVTLCDVGKDFDVDGIVFDARNIVINIDSSIFGNIYCLTGVYSKNLDGDRSDLIFNTTSFGESCIFIHNPKAFIMRICDKLKELGYKDIVYNPIHYYEDDYSGKLGVFKKHEKFSHQNEFRIFVPNSKNDILKFYIGSIEDIAIVSTGQNVVKLTHIDGKEQKIYI